MDTKQIKEKQTEIALLITDIAMQMDKISYERTKGLIQMLEKKMGNCFDEMVQMRAGHEELIAAAAEVISRYSNPKWIPVSKRWPTVGNDYIVTYDSGTVGYEMLSVNERNKNIVAWMPLPEPWKEKK